MSDSSLKNFDLAATVRQMSLETETSFAIRMASITEDWLQYAIKAKMRHLTKTQEDRIFSGYGPISSFRAKIDVGYALGIFDITTMNDLNAIREIRNKFAHSREIIHFRSKELDSLFQKMAGWTPEVDRQNLLVNRIADVVKICKEHIERRALADAVRHHSRKIQTESEKY